MTEVVDRDIIAKIDNDILSQHICREWEIRMGEVMAELASEFNKKYNVKVFYYSQDGLYAIQRMDTGERI